MTSFDDAIDALAEQGKARLVEVGTKDPTASAPADGNVVALHAQLVENRIHIDPGWVTGVSVIAGMVRLILSTASP
jgi:hypothetical protein